MVSRGLSALQLLACVGITSTLVLLFISMSLWSVVYQLSVGLTDTYGDARGVYHMVFGLLIMIGGATTLVTCAAGCLLFQWMAVSEKS